MKILKNQKGFGLIEGLLIVIALTLVVGVGYYVYNANKEDPKISDSSIQHKESTTEQKNEDTETGLIEYDQERGVEIKKAEDVSQLKGASESFKSYIADEIRDLNRDCNNTGTIQVFKILDDEFAKGGYGAEGCGGAGIVWKKKAGRWQAVLGIQAVPRCEEEIEKEKIPPQIVEECEIELSEGSFEIVKNPN